MERKIYLLIDTSSIHKTTVGLLIDDKKQILEDNRQLASQNLLLLIYMILKQNNLTIKDINAINVSIGPGSYTGLRVGIAVANALGAFLHIPINNKKIANIELPKYN